MQVPALAASTLPVAYGTFTMKEPHEYELLIEAIRELTAQVKRMVERIHQRLRHLERGGQRKSDEPQRKPLTDGSPGQQLVRSPQRPRPS